METPSVFDRLVEELNKDERRRLLQQIESGLVLSSEPLRPETSEAPGPDIESAFQALGSFLRFIYRLKGLFTGKSGEEAYMESLLARLKKDITHQSPKLADFRHQIFLDRMKTELDSLREAADTLQRFVFPTLEKNRAEFIAFLTRCHAEGLISRLEDETDPRTIIGEKSIEQESDIKAEMERRFLEILGSLPEDERRSIYLDCQSLEYLKLLCLTDFEGLLARFTFDKVRDSHVCAFAEIGKRLLTLADILGSARLPPSKTGLKAVCLFALRLTEGRQDEDLNDYLQREFTAAEEALYRIRSFNAHIPLGPLTKILANDYSYQTAGLKGGEDWFVIFKKYWAVRLSASYRDYVHALRTTTAEERAFSLLGTRRFEAIRNYHPSFYDQSLTVAHWRSLSFILAFFKNIFVPKMQKSLKVLFLNGEFYKTENRLEYGETFNFLSTINEKLLIFEKRLAPEGELGKPIAESKKENLNEPERLKKIELQIRKADAEALTMVQRTIDCLKILNKILNGILYSEAGGTYDTLSNLGYVGGKENDLLKKDWEKIISLSYEGSTVLLELLAVESPV